MTTPILLQEDQATGTARDVYDQIAEAFGMVPNFFKAQGAIDPQWLKLNWERVQHIMIRESRLDRKTKELIALTVSLVNQCQYCALVHQAMALMSGADQEQINEVKQIIELFSSFNTIADSLNIPCDITPPEASVSPETSAPRAS